LVDDTSPRHSRSTALRKPRDQHDDQDDEHREPGQIGKSKNGCFKNQTKAAKPIISAIFLASQIKKSIPMPPINPQLLDPASLSARSP